MGKSYELGLYEKATPQDLSWEERLRVAAEAGFDYMEISVDESDARQARLDWTAAERGVPLGSDAWRDDVAHASEFVREKIDAAMAKLG